MASSRNIIWKTSATLKPLLLNYGCKLFIGWKFRDVKTSRKHLGV
jgi:hypothetical protein